MEKKRSLGVVVISIMGLLAACLGMIGFPYHNYFNEIRDAFYVCGHWYFDPFSTQDFLFSVINIGINFVYIISIIGIFMLKKLARKLILSFAPISTILFIMSYVSLTPLPTPESLHYVSTIDTLAIISDFYVIVSAIVIIIYFTRPKVKEQFK